MNCLKFLNHIINWSKDNKNVKLMRRFLYKKAVKIKK